jgi:hypothetical protein
MIRHKGKGKTNPHIHALKDVFNEKSLKKIYPKISFKNFRFGLNKKPSGR